MKNGFTCIELAVVLALLALMGLILSPALARTRANTKAVQCLNNNQRLCQAWRLYAADNRDSILYASDDGTGTSNPSNRYAWVQNHLDFSPNNRGNWDTGYLKASPLWPYCGRNASIWKCPSDFSYVVVNGEKKRRIRSMAMNVYLGGFAGTDGGWRFITPYRLFYKTTELTPSPSRIFVFLDMRPDSVNWGNFITDMTGYSPPAPAQYQLFDLPGNLHNGDGTFSFGDGHAEMKRWRDPRTMPRPNALVSTPLLSPNNPDVAWIQDHATRKK